ncbi:hypothetical protein HDE_14345 [Halotydeus destructor]|nr:hypothetical protein HDE_14345 [Halotydeus destructor]
MMDTLHTASSVGIQILTNKLHDDYSAQSALTALVGSKVEISCDTSLPTAEDSITLILWYKGDRKSAPIYTVDARTTAADHAAHFVGDVYKHRAKFDMSNRLTASLRLDPVVEADDGVYLCRVDFKWGRTVNTITNLTVVDKPRVMLALYNHNGDSDVIIKGKEIRFDCMVKARPAILHDVLWFQNDRLLHHDDDIKSGIIIRNTTLLVKKCDPNKHGGHYYCSATNSQGTTVSNTVVVNISYAPQCKGPPGKVYEVPLGMVIDVPCQVEASPADVTFSWSFRDHGSLTGSSSNYGQGYPGHRKEPNARILDYSSNGLTSTAMFRSNSLADYGLLLCLPSSIIGNASQPCSFIIAPPSGPPKTPEGCLLSNKTNGDLIVECDHDQNMGQLVDTLADRGRDTGGNFVAFEDIDTDKIRRLLTIPVTKYHLDVYHETNDLFERKQLIGTFVNVQRPMFEVSAKDIGGKFELEDKSKFVMMVYASSERGNSSLNELVYTVDNAKIKIDKESSTETLIDQFSNYTSNLSAPETELSSLESNLLSSDPVILISAIISVIILLIILIILTQIMRFSKTPGTTQSRSQRDLLAPKMADSRVTKNSSIKLHHRIQDCEPCEHYERTLTIDCNSSDPNKFEHFEQFDQSYRTGVNCSIQGDVSFANSNPLSPDLIPMTSNNLHVLLVKPRSDSCADHDCGRKMSTFSGHHDNGSFQDEGKGLSE